jgi:hypothetical protein
MESGLRRFARATGATGVAFGEAPPFIFNWCVTVFAVFSVFKRVFSQAGFVGGSTTR